MTTETVMQELRNAKETFWLNPGLRPFAEVKDALPVSDRDIVDAEARLARFAPFIRKRFPETAPQGGLIESPLREIPEMRRQMASVFGEGISGRLFLKQDSELAIAGSVKARGGIYEVLKHSETLALKGGLLQNGDYTVFDTQESRIFFHQYSIHVGSTGNLGLSIGIMSAALGYRAVVHMSADARQWKKDLLRAKGVTVIEYASDYSKAVEEGRRAAEDDPYSYFVDDENSKDLFLGYAVAARRLAVQLREKGISVDGKHPLFVYIPCGVGGAPGGITFGLKHVFGDAVHCFFAEPTQAPCMLLGLVSGRHNAISVQDIGLTGRTAADGLAVGRASGFVGRIMEPLLTGAFTVGDEALFRWLRLLYESEGVFVEPSACAAFRGPSLAEHNLQTKTRMKTASHIIWATGGNLVPEEERNAYIDHCSLEE